MFTDEAATNIETVHCAVVLVALVLITLVELGKLTPTVTLAVAGVIAVLQFTLGPWLTDLSLRWFFKVRWQSPEELPGHLKEFVGRVCAEHAMRFPHMGLIDDGAPEAFTYGHHPNNARVVVSRGLLELLTPEEVEAVVAHELGHARNWDMALMTVAWPRCSFTSCTVTRPTASVTSVTPGR